MKTLIAEDDSVSRKYLSKFLSKYGECHTVVNGLEAIDAYIVAMRERQLYDLVCLDIMMPKIDGVKVLKAIRDLETQKGILPNKRAKIIMTTALAETDLVRTAFEYGCDDYAAKPIDIEKLTEIIKKLDLIKEGQ